MLTADEKDTQNRPNLKIPCLSRLATERPAGVDPGRLPGGG